jgi:hypothetical protein
MVALFLVAPGAGAAGGTKVLGTDAANDAPPGADLTALEVAKHGTDLHVRIVQSTVPSVGSYPEAGIQWSFTSGGRIFAVEAHQQSPGAYGFTLYEIKGGAFNVVDEIEGELTDDAFDMYVPLESISATKGTVVRGTVLEGATGDVEIHQHAGVASQILDGFKTTKPFKVR